MRPFFICNTLIIITMTGLHDLLVERRSIRRYTAEPVSAEDVKTILEAALLAPSSKSRRSWQLIAVDEPSLLKRLADCKPSGAAPVAEAPLAIIVGADMTVSEPWIEDASIAATLMQLQVTDLGLGSCWIQVHGRFAADDTPSEDYVRDLLGIPEQIGILCIITIGHKNEERQPQNTDKLLWNHVHINRWQPENE